MTITKIFGTVKIVQGNDMVIPEIAVSHRDLVVTGFSQ